MMIDKCTLSREQVRSLDRIAIEQFGIPGIILMENAGRGCAELLISQGICPSSPVIICCGKGNNGGDGFVMARHLEIAGYPVEILLFNPPEELTGDAALNYRIISKADIPIHLLDLSTDLCLLQKHLSRASWVVDALLGTGSTGQVRAPLDQAIDQINCSGKPVFSIDLPSGLDCDRGDPVDCCIEATVTGTLVAPKPGFRSPTGQAAIGELHLVNIGIPKTILAIIRGGVSSPSAVS